MEPSRFSRVRILWGRKGNRSSRSGINQSPESLEKLDKLISPLLKQGQPLSHIYLTHREETQLFPADSLQLYRSPLFLCSKSGSPRKVSYKPRKKRRSEPEIPGYRMGRTYLDFEQYIAAHPDCSIVEMDVVEGAGGKSSPVLLTLSFAAVPLCSFFSWRATAELLSGMFLTSYMPPWDLPGILGFFP